MNACIRPDITERHMMLLGTGTVGAAFVQRYLLLRDRGFALPRLQWLGNSRVDLPCADAPDRALLQARTTPQGGAGDEPARFQTLRRGDVLVDATASAAIACEHAGLLARGVHVVTANKLGQGASLQQATAISRAQQAGGARYGDAATVGAGLPLLRSIRALVVGGDRIHSIEGVLSGSLAWIFDRYDGAQPFSACVRQAMAEGFTEPDPRIDLSGEDIRRKLLILARAAGMTLEAGQVSVESLLPPALASCPLDGLDAQLPLLDVPMTQRLPSAGQGKLAMVARISGGQARVGVELLAPGHVLAGGAATDNRVAIYSDRYAQRPLYIQGAGAGAEVTAAALLDDVAACA